VPASMIHRSLSGFGLGQCYNPDDDSYDAPCPTSGSSCAGTLCADGSVMDADCVCGGSSVPSGGTPGLTPTGSPCPAAGTQCTDACGNSSFQDGNCNCIPTSSSCAGGSGTPIGGTPGAPCVNSSGQIGSYGSNGVCSGSGSSLTSSQISSLFSGAASVLKSVQTPYVIAGTGLVYNPATGQIVSGTAVNASAIASSLSSFMPILLIIVAAVVFLPSLGRK